MDSVDLLLSHESSIVISYVDLIAMSGGRAKVVFKKGPM